MKTLILALVSFIIYISFAGNIFASSLHLYSGSPAILAENTMSFDLVIDTKGESVNGVSAFLSYPKDVLEVAWITYGSAFPVQAEESYGDGSIKISRGSFTGETGNVYMATVGLKGKAIGEAVVSFAGGSAAPRTSDSSDSLNLSESTGATLKVGQRQVQSTVYFCFLLECLL